ncbi:hypothetical protein EZS27_043954, partial [termite gut metagenome]
MIHSDEIHFPYCHSNDLQKNGKSCTGEQRSEGVFHHHTEYPPNGRIFTAGRSESCSYGKHLYLLGSDMG